MTDGELDAIARLVRESFSPVGSLGAPEHDLWTDVVRRIEAPSPVSYLDAALCAALIGCGVVFPSLIPYWFYHL